MRVILITLIAGGLTLLSHGQGQFVFANRVPGLFDVPILVPGSGGAGVLGDVRAQLWTRDGSELLSESTFRGTDGILSQYFFQQHVTVEGNAGEPLDVELRFVLNGVPLTDPGDVLFTVFPSAPTQPASHIGGYLQGLNGGVDGPIFIPEPASMVLFALGIGALLLGNQRHQAFRF